MADPSSPTGSRRRIIPQSETPRRVAVLANPFGPQPAPNSPRETFKVDLENPPSAPQRKPRSSGKKTKRRKTRKTRKTRKPRKSKRSNKKRRPTKRR